MSPVRNQWRCTVALAAVWSRETEVETEAESKPVPIANDGDRFALPTDGRQAAHLREKRRLLYEYLVAGPKVFFKSIRTISQELTISWAWDDPVAPMAREFAAYIKDQIAKMALPRRGWHSCKPKMALLDRAKMAHKVL